MNRYVLMRGSGDSEDWSSEPLAIYDDYHRAQRIAARMDKAWKWHRSRASNYNYFGYLETYYVKKVKMK